MARVLIIGGEQRGARLAAALLQTGHAVRLVIEEHASEAIGGGSSGAECSGAECFRADPERPGTLKAALEHVSVACWLFGGACGTARVEALNGGHLQRFLEQALDSSAHAIVYEAAGQAPEAALSQGRALATAFAARNAIPLSLITADGCDADAWLRDARGAVARALGSAPEDRPGTATSL
jgi:hypothetical protein